MDERSGFITFLLGMVVVVVVSLFLSLAVEKRFAFSNQKGDIEQSIDSGKESLASVKGNLAESADHLDRSLRRLARISARNEELRKRFDDQEARIVNLKAKKIGLQAEMMQVNEAFIKHQSQYRKRVWEKAIGEKLPVLTTKSGRQYLEVRIVNVTQAGIDIRHETGMARVGAGDFPDDWQDRFQWAPPGSRLKGN